MPWLTLSVALLVALSQSMAHGAERTGPPVLPDRDVRSTVVHWPGYTSQDRSTWSIRFQPMTRILFGLVLFFTALVQATVLPRVNPISMSPDLVLVMLFLWSSSHGLRESLAWIFFTGLLLDVLALDAFGSNGLALLTVVLLSGSGRRRFFHFNIVVPILMVFVATIAHGVVISVLRGAPPGWPLVLQGLMHAVLLPLFAMVSRFVSR